MSVYSVKGRGWRYDFTLNGNRTRLTDPKNQITNFEYDDRNRLTRKIYADSTSESFTYFRWGGMETRTNARGATITYGYDYAENLNSVSFNDGGQVLYNYDRDIYNRLIGIYRNGVSQDAVFYDYDANSRLVGVNGMWSSEGVTLSYDDIGRRTGMTRLGGQPVTYTYDNRNRLTRARVDGQNYNYTYVTTASPLVQTLTRPGGAVTTYTYDTLKRLTQMTTQRAGVTLSQYAYTYNLQDLRDSETATEATPAYGAEAVTYTYNNVNELTRLEDPGVKDLVYDADGNLTQGYTPQGFPFTATYDAENRLTSLTYTDQGGVAQRTEYQHLGRFLSQMKKYANGGLVSDSRHVYDGNLLVQEQDAGSPGHTVIREYTYGLSLPGGIGGLLHLSQGAPYLYSYLYDGRGNVTALLDSSSNVVQTYQYDTFGIPKGSSGSVSQPVRFSTKPYDEQTGLSYYGYRFYAPAVGRWLTRDPIGEAGGINLYGFVGNDPINSVDPDGMLVFAPAGYALVNYVIMPAAIITYGYLQSPAGQALLTQSTKDVMKIIDGLLNTAEDHADKIATNPPEDPNQNKWRREMKAALDRCKNLAEKRLPGKLRDQVINAIDAIQNSIL